MAAGSTFTWIMIFLSTSTLIANQIVTEVELKLQPLWNTTANNTPYCFVENSTDEEFILFRGGSHNSTCSLQVTAPHGYYIGLQTPENNLSNEFKFLYFERIDDHDICPNKYVTFTDHVSCRSLITHPKIQIVLQGAASLFINKLPVAEFVPNCLEFGTYATGLNVSQKTQCSVKGYEKMITCDTYREHVCRFKFPTTCNNTLSFREATFQCPNHALFENQTAMIIYPLQMTTLNLSHNGIVLIHAKTFNGLTHLKILDLTNNRLVILNTDTFFGLYNLESLFLHKNSLVTLDNVSFKGIEKLKDLYLYRNMLQSLPQQLVYNLRLSNNLFRLFLGENQIPQIQPGSLSGLIKLSFLGLDNNMIQTLPTGIFNDMKGVMSLYLDDNQLQDLPIGLFQNLTNLRFLGLGNNQLTSLPPFIIKTTWFYRVSQLYYLNLSGNGIQTLSDQMFRGWQNLKALMLSDNKFVALSIGILHDLILLQYLDLTKNRLAHLTTNVFARLTILEDIMLSYNHLQQIDEYVFRGLTYLKQIFLAHNMLKHLDPDLFIDTSNLSFIDLSSNQLTDFPVVLTNLVHLEFLDLTDNPFLWITSKTFSSLSSTVQVSVSQHEVCECYIPYNITCSAVYHKSPYFTCDRLLSDKVLTAIMWLIAITAIAGNAFVLVWRNQGYHTHKINAILLQNLAMSDLLMGIYMLIIASADLKFGDHFPLQSATWRSGIMCKIAGALSIISSEASVFFVTLVSIDRFLCIRFPYSTKKIEKKSVLVLATLVWIVALLLGIIPSILSSSVTFKFYDNSHVCIGLPLALTKTYTTKTIQKEHNSIWGSFYTDTYITQESGLVNGLYFSTTIFLGLNCVCYLLILGCYVELVRAVRKSAKKSGRTPDMKEQIKLTTKVTAIVATDFFCWFPIIVLGILVQTRVIELPSSVYAWCVTVVLPINSAINPYLYTISEVISAWRKKQSIKKETYPEQFFATK